MSTANFRKQVRKALAMKNTTDALTCLAFEMRFYISNSVNEKVREVSMNPLAFAQFVEDTARAADMAVHEEIQQRLINGATQ